MSSFSCPLVEVTIHPHENADNLEIAQIFGYCCIVRRGQYRTGDRAVYIPEASIVPRALLEEMGLLDKLHGAEKNRVKAVKLRGVLSQGLLYAAPKGIVSIPGGASRSFDLGENAADFLGIKKYEPEIPTGMAGELTNLGANILPRYDIENIKNYPTLFEEGEPVCVTEKIHGTFCGVGLMPFEHKDLIHGRVAVFGKTPGASGLAFKDNEANKNNLYLKMVKKYGIDKILLDNFAHSDEPVFIMGEIFGAKVQDLHYGFRRPVFRAFDFAVGFSNKIRYTPVALSFSPVLASIPRVPKLYSGPFIMEKILELTSGPETVSSQDAEDKEGDIVVAQNIREGVVIRPQTERFSPKIGRVILKSVSEQYLLRRNGTEFN